MRIGKSHTHIAESTESLTASSLILLLQVLSRLCESLCHCWFSPFGSVWMYAIFREWWSWFSMHRHGRTSWASENLMSIGESHENGRIACAYERVNRVNRCQIQVKFRRIPTFSSATEYLCQSKRPNQWKKNVAERQTRTMRLNDVWEGHKRTTPWISELESQWTFWRWKFQSASLPP
jgi:hypothetical protein